MLNLKSSPLCWLLVFVAASIGFADENSPKSNPSHQEFVFLLIGQSNMAGRAHLKEGDKAPISGVKMLDDKGQWIAATNPLNRFSTDRKTIGMQRIGPGFGFAKAFKKALPKAKVKLIVNARGGSSINRWKTGGDLYDNMLKRVRAVKGIKVSGVLWHQGESDRNDQQYQRKLETLIATLRKDFDSPNLPFVAGKVHGRGHVNDVFDKLPKNVPHTAVADVDGLKVFDGVHFDRDSQIALGERYAAAMIELLRTPEQQTAK